MAQIVKVVDITKSFLPVDPNAFANNLHYTKQEDSPDEMLPIVPYEGYNFLPTSYGYRSYFGTDSTLDLEALPKPCDSVITFQSFSYENMLIAFCSDGIRTARAGDTTWTHLIPLPDDYTTSGTYRQYTWTVIENNLYIYRQGLSLVYKIDEDLVLTSFTPSFLNMSGQIGLFRGNGRLCFWDSENSVAWSSAFDLTDFTPSIENMVGNATFLSVLGRIITILPHGEGYIIYSTRSVVGVSYSTSGTTVWDANAITSSAGIAHPGACCIGQNDKEHFAFTSSGIVSIGHYNALSRQYALESVLPELFDFLKESRDPVYMQCHASRFLYFAVIDDSYITGITSFTEIEVPSLEAPIVLVDSAKWATDLALDYLDPNDTFQMINSFLWKANGVTITDRTLSVYEAPTYCAVFSVPNHPSVANEKGFFSNVGAWFKHSEPSIADISDYNKIVEDAFYKYAFANIINPYTKGTSEIIRGINKPTEDGNTHKSFYTPSGYFNIKTEEMSFIPKLYPQDILGQGNSCFDLMYNFMGAVLEYEDFIKKNYEQVIETVNAINTKSYFTRSVYSAQPLTITSTQDTTAFYIPSGGVSVFAGMDFAASSVNNPRLNIAAKIRNYAKVDATICSRNLKEIKRISVVDAKPNYEFYLVQMYGQSHGATSPKVIFDHMPDEEELLSAFSQEDMYLTSNLPETLGHKFKLYYDENYVSPSLFGMQSQFWVFAKDQTTGLTAGNFVLNARQVDRVEPYTTAVSSETHAAYSTDDLYHLTIEEGYSYLSAARVPFTQTNNIINRGCTAVIFWHWKWTINNSSVNSISYQSYLGPIYEIDKTYKVSYKTLSNGTILLYAGVRPYGTLDPITEEAVIAIPPVLLYEHVIEEELIYALNPVNCNNAGIDSYEDPSAEFNINFTQTGIDTIYNRVTGPVAVHKSTRFTPTVTNPGEGIALAFTPETRELGGQWHTPYDYMQTIQDCIPWNIGDRILDFQQQGVKGQHFMAHAANLMLTVEQPLGPILSLSDESNACYPDMNWEGWTSVDLSDFTYPPTSWTLQDGSPIPAYPMFTGALVLDMHLKKWGKFAGEYDCLLQFAPINALTDGVIPYTNFGVDSGIVDHFDKKLKLFSSENVHTVMRYGKIGLYRLGFTEILEVTLHFRTAFTGKITVDGSIDGRDLNLDIQHVEEFTNTRTCVVKCHVNAKWHTISIAGNFDLQYMEFRGIVAGRR